MTKQKLLVYQQLTANPLTCIENVIYSYIYFRVVRFKRQLGFTSRQISKGTGIARTQTVTTALRALQARGVVYREEGRWLPNGVPDGWYRKRKDGQRFFMMAQVPKPRTLTLKQNLVYWKLCDLKRIYGSMECIGGVWHCGRRQYRASGIAKILGIDKATVLRSANLLVEKGLLDNEWNIVADPPDLWRDSSSTVGTKAKSGEKHRTITYAHPQMQAKWDSLMDARVPFNLAEDIANLDYFVSIEIGDLVDIIRSARKLIRQNMDTGATSVNHPGFLIRKEMRRLDAIYRENQQRCAASAVA
jgi:predicted transcriptional regulator